MEHRRREPAPGIFRLVLPLPFPGLKHVNAYLLADADGFTLVDCGIFDPGGARDHGWGDLENALGVCGATPADITRLVVTHPHIDHYGMAGRVVARADCELAMHALAEDELDMYRNPHETVTRLRELYRDHGVADEDLDDLTAYEDWRGFVSEVVSATSALQDEQSLTVGERTWSVVHTPGHSRSHVCLWSAQDGVLISGDHLLPAITPHIDFRRGADADPLGEFLASLTRIEKLDPKLVLPGHGRPFEEGAERARVNARHHDRRLGSSLQIIRREPHTASEITNEIWGPELLNFERRLALGEALAHLAYLVRRDEVERIEHDGVFKYKKADRRAPAV